MSHLNGAQNETPENLRCYGADSRERCHSPFRHCVRIRAGLSDSALSARNRRRSACTIDGELDTDRGRLRSARVASATVGLRCGRESCHMLHPRARRRVRIRSRRGRSRFGISVGRGHRNVVRLRLSPGNHAQGRRTARVSAIAQICVFPSKRPPVPIQFGQASGSIRPGFRFNSASQSGPFRPGGWGMIVSRKIAGVRSVRGVTGSTWRAPRWRKDQLVRVMRCACWTERSMIALLKVASPTPSCQCSTGT